MRKVFIFLLLFSWTCTWVGAQSSEDKRRVEESRRQDLLPSEGMVPGREEKEQPKSVFNQKDFFSQLMGKKIVTRSDAYQSLIILLSVVERYRDPPAQFRFLTESRFLPKELQSDPDFIQPFTKGQFAFALCKALRIKGGIILRVFGVTERYALKELVYQSIMSPGHVKDSMNGEEFIRTLTKAADYLADAQEKENKK